jgi:chromate transporter
MNDSKPRLREIAGLFLRLGSTAFGGPAAHIAMMEDEVVRRRRWLSQPEFLDLLGATNLIPGPNSTEMAIHIGYKMGGWRGLMTAGIMFIGPAFLIVWAIAWFYARFGNLPEIHSIFLGIKPVILAVVAQAIWSLSRSAIKDRVLAILCLLALGLYLVWQNEIAILFVITVINFLARLKWNSQKVLIPLLASLPFYIAERSWAQAAIQAKVPLDNLFLFFAKVGSVLFGSGYVLIAFLQSDLVDHYHWISQQQLVDAIAVGQFTPGPVFTTATFIGYLVAGHAGAFAATVAIFLPAFLFVALSAPLIPRLRRSPWTAPVLDGLNVASLSLIVGAEVLLAKTTLVSAYGILAFALSLILLLKFKLNSVWLIVVAGILGVLGFAT